MDSGFVKNTTNITQIIGRHEIEPNAIALVPIEVVDALRGHPIPQLKLIEDDPAEWVFKTTNHQPFNERYKKR